MGSTAMDKKKDASSSSSSSRKSSSHKKLMLRVHIPVSGSSFFLLFGSWRGLGVFVSDMERSERQGEVFPAPSSALWGTLGWGAALNSEPSTPGVGWREGCSAGSSGCSPGHGGVSSLSQFHSYSPAVQVLLCPGLWVWLSLAHPSPSQTRSKV